MKRKRQIIRRPVRNPKEDPDAWIFQLPGSDLRTNQIDAMWFGAAEKAAKILGGNPEDLIVIRRPIGFVGCEAEGHNRKAPQKKVRRK